jgi:hypothetical protein
MDPREEDELKNMALAAELARQLCHDFRNFLYNVSLQIEADAAASPASPLSENWLGIKKEVEKTTQRLRDWDQFQQRFSYAESAVDLHEVIRQLGVELAPEGYRLQLAASIQAGPQWISSSPLGCRHLLRLLVEDACHSSETTIADVDSAVTIQTEATTENALVRIMAKNRCAVRAPTLVTSAAQAIALRIGATVRSESSADQSITCVEFPLQK